MARSVRRMGQFEFAMVPNNRIKNKFYILDSTISKKINLLI